MQNKIFFKDHKLDPRFINLLIISTFIFLSSNLLIAQSDFDQITLIQIPAPSLKNNCLGDLEIQPNYICLPPSYSTTDKRYPVIYFLHGFNESPSAIEPFRYQLNKLINKKQINEFILVGVNGNNKLGGSFYVNSIVTGNWEDYVISDVVSYIDKNYRTIPNATARAITGFSMGGFGAINIAFRHPEVFSVLYCFAPGLFAPGGLQAARTDSWDGTNILPAYGAAFAPDLQKQFPFADIPNLDGSDSDKLIEKKWENGFGNFKEKIDTYIKQGRKLKAIKIEYGIYDGYIWIPEGCEYLSKLLTDAKIKHELVKYKGTHYLNTYVQENDMFPFLSQNLDTN